jgi:hypothetical protein
MDVPLSQKRLVPETLEYDSQPPPRAPPNPTLQPLKNNIRDKFFGNFYNSIDMLIRSSTTDTDKQNTAVFVDDMLFKLGALRSKLPSGLSSEQEEHLRNANKLAKTQAESRMRNPFGSGTRRRRKRKGSRRSH